MPKPTSTDPRELLLAVNIIAKDADEAEEALETEDSPRLRRVWIRAYFSWVEAFCYLLRQHVLKERFQKQVIRPDDIAEFTALSEIRYSVTQKGEAIVESANTRTVDYIVFSLLACARYHRLGLNISPGGDERKQITQAVGIRNRITHPKILTDVEITDQDKEDVLAFKNWFSAYLEILFNSDIQKAIRKEIGIAKRTKKERTLVFDDSYFQSQAEQDDEPKS